MIAESSRLARQAFETGEYQGEYRVYSKPSQLFEVLPPKRWALIVKLAEIGPSSLRGLARALSRDVKRVHEDAAVLLKEGIIERDEQSRLFVPFASIRIQAELKILAA